MNHDFFGIHESDKIFLDRMLDGIKRETWIKDQKILRLLTFALSLFLISVPWLSKVSRLLLNFIHKNQVVLKTSALVDSFLKWGLIGIDKILQSLNSYPYRMELVLVLLGFFLFKDFQIKQANLIGSILKK